MLDLESQAIKIAFTLLTNQKPLMSMYNIQHIDQILNTRIWNCRLSLVDYNSTVEYLPGKFNVVNECLNRKTLWENYNGEDVSTFAEVRLENFHNGRSDPLLQCIFEEAAVSDDYNKIIETLRDYMDPKQLQHEHPVYIKTFGLTSASRMTSLRPSSSRTT
jgi:hypothetical protein